MYENPLKDVSFEACLQHFFGYCSFGYFIVVAIKKILGPVKKFNNL